MLWHIDPNGVVDEAVSSTHDENGKPRFHKDFIERVVNDGGAAGVSIGWVWKNGSFSPPAARQYTPTQLLDYGSDKVSLLHATARPYAVSGLKEPIFDDIANSTHDGLNKIYAARDVIEWPLSYTDENYARLSLTEDQFTDFYKQAVAYWQKVWGFYNDTVVDAVKAGKVKSPEDIDALGWPK